MTTDAHHRSHTFRPIRNAVTLIDDLFKFGICCFGADMLAMLILALYFHI